MTKARRAQYTLEFKQEALRMVESRQSMAGAARGLGMVEQPLYHWARRSGKGGRRVRPAARRQLLSKWKSVDCEPSWRGGRWSVTSWEKRRRTSRKARNEVRLFSRSPAGVVPGPSLPGDRCENTPQTRPRSGGRFLRCDGSNFLRRCPFRADRPVKPHENLEL